MYTDFIEKRTLRKYYQFFDIQYSIKHKSIRQILQLSSFTLLYISAGHSVFISLGFYGLQKYLIFQTLRMMIITILNCCWKFCFFNVYSFLYLIFSSCNMHNWRQKKENTMLILIRLMYERRNIDLELPFK